MTIKTTKRKANKRRVAACVGNEAGIVCNKKARTEAKVYRCQVCKKLNSLNDLPKRFRSSYIALELIKLCKRAGTVEALVNVEEVDKWFKLVQERRSYGLVDGQQLNIAHLVAVGGVDKVGLNTSDNTLLVQAKANITLGNKEVHGNAKEGLHYLHRNELQDRFKVSDLDSMESFISKMESFLGRNNLYSWLSGIKFKTMSELRSDKAKRLAREQAKKDAGEVVYVHKVTSSMFSVMLRQHRKDGNWIEPTSVIEFDVALEKYHFKYNKFIWNSEEEQDYFQYYKHSEFTKLGYLLQESLLKGSSRILDEAASKLLIMESLLGGE
jgi:hypothetical protein